MKRNNLHDAEKFGGIINHLYVGMLTDGGEREMDWKNEMEVCFKL